MQRAVHAARLRQALDRAVDRLYRKKPFASDKERLGLLFERYRALMRADPDRSGRS